jgi:hypothetical protein
MTAPLADIRARHERTTHPDWRDDTDTGQLLAEVDRLRAERDQFADRVDTLTAVCKSNALAHRVAVEECERLRVERERVVELIESSTEAWLTNPSVNMRTALALLRDETAAVSDPTTTP